MAKSSCSSILEEGTASFPPWILHNFFDLMYEFLSGKMTNCFRCSQNNDLSSTSMILTLLALLDSSSQLVDGTNDVPCEVLSTELEKF